MTTFNEACESLAGAVKVTGLPCSAYPMTVINAPCAQVAWQPFDPRLVMSKAKTAYEFIVGVFFPSAIDANAAKQLHSYIDPASEKSVTRAIEDGGNWDATVDYASVTLVGALSWVEIAGAQYAFVPFTVEVCW